MGCLAQGSRREQRNQLLVTKNIVLHKCYIHPWIFLYTKDYQIKIIGFIQTFCPSNSEKYIIGVGSAMNSPVKMIIRINAPRTPQKGYTYIYDILMNG